MDFRDLAQVFIRAFSPSAAILAGAQYTVEDNTVTIHLRANGKDSILQNAKKGEQFLRERFGVTKKIEVEAHSNLEGKALFEETARIRAEALKNTPAIQPSAQAPGAAPAARAPRSAPAPQEPTGALFYGRPFSGRAVRMDELNLDMFRGIASEISGCPASIWSVMPVRSMIFGCSGRCGSTNIWKVLSTSLPFMMAAPISMIVSCRDERPVVSRSKATYSSSKEKSPSPWTAMRSSTSLT